MKNFRKQQGAALLLELAIVAIITTFMIASQINDVKNKAVEAQFSAQGDLMNTLKGAVSTYIANNYSSLVNGTGVAFVANAYAPTIAELQNPAVSTLPSGFNSNSLLGPSYVIKIEKSPAACTPPACDITGMAYLNGPVIDSANGRVDVARLGVALSQIGGDGAMSDSMDPSSVRGIGGAFTLANPAGSIAGVLAVRTGYGSSAFSQFLRRDGSLPMTGALDMGTKDIVSGGGAAFQGGSSAKSVNVAASTFYGDTANSAIRQPGGLYIQHQDGSASDIASVGNVYSNGTVGSNAVQTNNANVSGNINAGTVTLPAGNTLRIAGVAYYGDSTNAAVRTGGAFYVQNIYNGSPAQIVVGNVASQSITNSGYLTTAGIGNSGYLTTAGIGNSGDLNTQGTMVTNRDYWSVISRNGAGNDNASPTDAAGSIYINDAYFRSVGKWASQLGGGIGDGQSWYNLSGSRAAFTNYGNYTGKAIMVNVSIDSASGGSLVGYMYVNGVQVGSYNNYNQRYNNSGYFSAIVPNGGYYSVSLWGSNSTIPTWSELR
jgi:hypothetical protein